MSVAGMPNPLPDIATRFQPDYTPEQLENLGVYDALYRGKAPRIASLGEWKPEWISEHDPKGWAQWYKRYASGRRIPDEDERQIKRWLSFKARHGGPFAKNPTPRRGWALRNWGIDPAKLVAAEQANSVTEMLDDYKSKAMQKYVQERVKQAQQPTTGPKNHPNAVQAKLPSLSTPTATHDAMESWMRHNYSRRGISEKKPYGYTRPQFYQQIFSHLQQPAQPPTPPSPQPAQPPAQPSVPNTSSTQAPDNFARYTQILDDRFNKLMPQTRVPYKLNDDPTGSIAEAYVQHEYKDPTPTLYLPNNPNSQYIGHNAWAEHHKKNPAIPSDAFSWGKAQPRSLVGLHEREHVQQAVPDRAGYAVVGGDRPTLFQNSAHAMLNEPAAVMGELVNATDAAHQATNSPVSGSIDLAPGYAPSLEWMRQQAKQHGYDGLGGNKNMTELINTPAGQAWMKMQMRNFEAAGNPKDYTPAPSSSPPTFAPTSQAEMQNLAKQFGGGSLHKKLELPGVYKMIGRGLRPPGGPVSFATSGWSYPVYDLGPMHPETGNPDNWVQSLLKNTYDDTKAYRMERGVFGEAVPGLQEPNSFHYTRTAGRSRVKKSNDLTKLAPKWSDRAHLLAALPKHLTDTQTALQNSGNIDKEMTDLALIGQAWLKSQKQKELLAARLKKFQETAQYPSLAAPPQPELKVAELKPEVKLQDHQQRIQDRAITDSPRMLVYHGLGSGKSLSAIAAAEAARKLHGGNYGIAVPASLRDNFRKEIKKFTTGDSKPEVLSYTGLALGKKFQDPPETLIMDEAARLRNPNAASTRAATQAARQAQRVLLLTGTPITNSPGDLAPLVSMLHGESIDPKDFEQRYVGHEKVWPGLWNWLRGIKPGVRSKVKRRDELVKLLENRVDYQPSKTPEGVNVNEEVIRTPLTSEQQKIEKAIRTKIPPGFLWKLDREFPLSKDELRRLNGFLTGLRQVGLSTQSFRADKDPVRAFEQSGKLTTAMKNLRKVLDEDPRKKAIIYSNFIDAGIKPYAAALARDGVPAGVFHGGVPLKKRRQVLDDYNAGKIRALLLGPAAAEGISTKGTSLIQLLDPHWNEARLQQAKGRGLRFDSHRDLPEELKNVAVQRYLNQSEEPSTLGRWLMGKKRHRTADEVLERLTAEKEELNNAFRELLKEVGTRPRPKPEQQEAQ
jgi:hypothetical protein